MATAPISPFDRWFVDPLPPGRWAMVMVVSWIVGAAYCLGYQAVLSGEGSWGGSLLWSAHSVLPWFVLVDATRQSEWRWIRRPSHLAGVMTMVCIGSIAAELVMRWLAGDGYPPVGLLVLRRLPPAAVALLLILIAWRLARRPIAPRSEPVVRLRQASPAVRWIAAADNYVELHSGGRCELLRMTMADAQRQLEGRGFCRIHRRYIVNCAHVAAIERDGRSVRLVDGTCLPIGKAFISELRALA